MTRFLSNLRLVHKLAIPALLLLASGLVTLMTAAHWHDSFERQTMDIVDRDAVRFELANKVVTDLLAGTLTLPLPPGRPLQQLDRSDLGSFVELILRDPDRFRGTRTELASDAPTPAEMCRALSAALGREVRFAETATADIGSPDMAAMWTFLRTRGYQADIETLRREYPGVGWTTFSKWAERALASSGRNPGTW